MTDILKKTLISNIKSSLDDFLYHAFIDLPSTYTNIGINELHNSILATLLTEIAIHHLEYYVDEEEEE